MNKYSKEFLMSIAEKVVNPITKTYILCIEHLLEYDLEYLKKNGITQHNFYQAIETIVEVTKNYDYVKVEFDLIVESVKRGGILSGYPLFIDEIISTLIKGDKDKYEEYILNKLFGDVWKDPFFFLPKNHFLGLSDRLPTLGDLLFRNTTFSGNIPEELSKKIINGLKILYETIPELIERSFYYKGTLTFSDCAVTKYIKQDLKLRQSCEMENAIRVNVYKDYIQIVKYIFLKVKRRKYRDHLFEKLTQQFSKMCGISIRKSSLTITLEREERINLPANFIL